MSAAARRNKLVVLEHGYLASLANSAEFIREFPILKQLASASATPRRAGGCGGCGRSNRVRADAYQRVKEGLAAMDSNRKQRLKQMLNADQVRIVYRSAQGRAIKMTF